MHVCPTPSRLPVRSTVHARVGHQLTPLTTSTVQQYMFYHAASLLDYAARLSSHQIPWACTQGLGLRDFTESGWADSSQGRMHVGKGEHEITDTEVVEPKTERTKKLGSSKPRIEGSAGFQQEPRKPWSPWTSSAAGTLRKLSTHLHWKRASHTDSDSPDDGEIESVKASVRSLQMDEQEELESDEPLMSGGDWHIGMFEDEALGIHKPGRNLLGKVKKSVRGDKCWWSPKGTSCEDYYASFTLPDGTVVPGSRSSKGSNQSGKNTVGTRSRLSQGICTYDKPLYKLACTCAHCMVGLACPSSTT